MMKIKMWWIAWGAILLAGHVLADPSCAPQHALRVEISSPIGSQTWKVKTASTPEARERGLSGQNSLPVGHGVWFVMPEPGRHAFWMKDMRFSIDLVWIAPDLHIAGVETLTPCIPGQPCPVHYAPGPVSFVLEIPAGTFSVQNRNQFPNQSHNQTSGLSARWYCTP